jgi:fatty acid/phospholipid biosynthesis enzyme
MQFREAVAKLLRNRKSMILTPVFRASKLARDTRDGPCPDGLARLRGVNGVVVKCHGDSSPETFIHGIKGALRLVQHGFLEKIKAQL